MKEWAEIYRSKISGIHKMPDDLIPEFNPNSFLYAVEITSLDPKPSVDWKYDLETGEFSEPDIIYLNPITSKTFFLRLTGTEREVFIASMDDKVRQFVYWLTLSGDVDLSDSKVITGTNYLESSGIVGTDRAAEILIIETT